METFFFLRLGYDRRKRWQEGTRGQFLSIFSCKVHETKHSPSLKAFSLVFCFFFLSLSVALIGVR